MKLSELETGQKGVVIKVIGHGGFRKRIVEMGFIRGKVVEVLLNAPMRDPVKYSIMGYEISLRREEAGKIEIMTFEEAQKVLAEQPQCAPLSCSDQEELVSDDQRLKSAAMTRRRTINVALVGNPNCGKTSLFNFASGAHERVGNYSGVTVDAKEGKASYEGYEFNIVDLPGTYSLTAYSPEERYVRKHIIENTPDVVINVIDAGNLERNLYLTSQLIDMHIRMVCALNMFDEMEKRGDTLNCGTLERLLGVPIVPTVFKTGAGVKNLFHVIINMYEGADFVDAHGNIDPEVADDIRRWHSQLPLDQVDAVHVEDFASGSRPREHVARHIHINHGQYVENAITMVQDEIKHHTSLGHIFSTRYLAIKLLEFDDEVADIIGAQPNGARILSVRDKASQAVKDDTQSDSETAIMEAKYGFIRGALAEAGYVVGPKGDTYKVTHAIDAVLTHKWYGIPLFFLILFLMFHATFSAGRIPMEWIESGVDALCAWLSSLMTPSILRDMIVDGAVAGVGTVIVFLPQVLILYFFIALMEDTGYMSRVSFIMDKSMHKMGLHGKSFVPLIMSFGCNVPAVLSTRSIESHRARIVTMLVVPFMSCSARLPVYVMIVGSFFAVQWQSVVLLSIYAAGAVAAVFFSRILSRFIIKDDDAPFVMELPPYRFPTLKSVGRHTWDRARQYVRKMGGVILAASLLVWALGYFPHDESLSCQKQMEQSIIGRVGRFIEPAFEPLGFNWKHDVSIIAGMGAKEIVASTLGVLYAYDEEDVDASAGDAAINNPQEINPKYEALYAKMSADGMTPVSAYAYLLFVLLYFPCFATLAAIRSETGSWRWTLFSAFVSTAIAWVVAAMVNQVGLLL